MSMGAIEAGRAFVRLLVNDTDLQKGLKSAQAKLKMFASATGTLGRQMMGLSAAIAAPAAAGIKAFADFEQQMAQVSTMLDDPAQFMGQFSEGIKQLSIEFGEGTDTLAKGLYDILSASVEPAKAMDVLTVSVRAAKAGLSDTGVAADAITTVLNAYQMSADKAGSVSDWLFGVVKRGKTTFSELAPSIGKVATVAASVGVSIEELGAMIATLTRNGVKTDQAMSAIGATIGAFIKPSQEASEYAAELGINLSAATIQADGLAGVFRKIADLPPDAIGRLFPNIEALRGILPALRGLEGFSEDMAFLGDAAGTTEDAYGKLAKTIGTQFKQVKQAVIAAAVEIGEALAVDMAAGAESIKSIVEYVTDWIERHQGLVKVLAKSAIVIGAVGGGLLALSAAASTAAMALGVLNTALVIMAANPVAAVLAAIVTSVSLLTYVQGELAQANIAVNDAQRGLLESGDKQRSQDMQSLQRLQSLADKTKLSSAEMEEAATVIEKLEESYGDLGLSLDATTGKITGVADAYDLMAKAMETNVAKQVKLAAVEAITNAELLGAELDRIRQTWLMNPFGKTKLMDELSREMEKEATKAAALTKRLQELAKGNPEAVVGGLSPIVSATAAGIEMGHGPIMSAAEFQASMDERLHQARLAMIDDEKVRALQAIADKHAAEMEAAKKDKQDIGALSKVQGAEVQVIETEHRRRREEEERRAAEDQARNRKELAEEVADLTLETQYEGIDLELARIEQQRKRALAEAAELGLSVDQVNKKFDLLSQIAKSRDTLPDIESKISTAGTFSAAQAMRMGGRASDTEKQIAENTKQTAAASQKTARYLEAGFSLI